MKLFDVNILIYAHREEMVYHDFYRMYLEEQVNRGEPFGLSVLVAAGFLRIVTHPRFPGGPTTPPQALAVIESLERAPNCLWVQPGSRHWEILSDLCRSAGSTGKHVADAQHAAVAIENGCTWVTRDEDFETYRKRGLRLDLIRPGS